MKILLLVSDLYKNIGGGQTVYKKIIEDTPGCEFYYFIENEKLDAQRPANAHPVKKIISKKYCTSRELIPAYLIENLNQVLPYAESVAGMLFDVVDIPDYCSFGYGMREIFEMYGVKVGRFVLAMHGNISDSIRLNWQSQPYLEAREAEFQQFSNVDGLYAISERYIAEWKGRKDRDVEYISPTPIVKESQREKNIAKNDQKRPDLYCIGRMERRKGNDIFIELSRWIDPDLYDKSYHVGDADFDNAGVSSTDRLYSVSVNRGLDLNFVGPVGWDELEKIFASRAMLVLPVRYDTLNLQVLEALFNGCPVAVSNKAGVCDYLDKEFPEIPYVKIDFDNIYASVADIENILRNYDEYCEKLTSIVNGLPLFTESFNMHQIYSKMLSKLAVDPQAMGIKLKRTLYLKAGAISSLKESLPDPVFELLKRTYCFFKTPLREHVKRSFIAPLAFKVHAILDYRSRVQRLRDIFNMRESGRCEISNKLNSLYDLGESSHFLRKDIWQAIGRLERIQENDEFYATYLIRTMRSMGTAAELPEVLRAVERCGMPHTAKALDAMYGDPEKTAERVYQYLKSAEKRNMHKPALECALEVDERSSESPKVSIIVSLYNAADKIPVFMTALLQQTLVKKGEVEFIFEDSNSPADEYAAIQKTCDNQVDYYYERSQGRETIQCAWNRGIAKARAPYLVFLGVDEVLYPDALEKLADFLDKNTETDWVMSDSLVTEVTPEGVLERDVMPYARSRTKDVDKDHVYLETCYLSWVGGMYRKSMHKKCGYYDETFRGAGDTEFKNRILSKINVAFFPETLGLFLNYPEERTTASPMAELEDLRAWYIYRSLGGVRYAFEDRPIEDAIALFYKCLGYRKSYCGHISTDFDYAYALSEYISQKNNDPQWKEWNRDICEIKEILKSFDSFSQNEAAIVTQHKIAKKYARLKMFERKHYKLLNGERDLHYAATNDNRYEQHSWMWRS
ncbi:glycosyltransferase [Desulfovibrio sp. JC022]|uniref:glycosyltransferase n=1 Tax=Desulfovibrio sp. JC022 TaxID=2593642 RepID=UPI0013D74916|nr:glycosyltransferase [Desulfovibrio sp. JC022]NDV24958.1 glycosyltransferase [Desulfovibrio sp. JC022]